MLAAGTRSAGCCWVRADGHRKKGRPAVGERGPEGEQAPTVTLCWPVRLGHSHRSWLSEWVSTQGVSPMNTV